MAMIFILLFSLGLVLLIITIATEGCDILSYHLYRGTTLATVTEYLPCKFERSKATVERQLNGTGYERIKTTEDNSVGHFPFYHALFEKNKVQYVLEWEVNEAKYRGYYRHLKNANTWELGKTITLHYSTDKPWKYAIYDQQLRIKFLISIAFHTILMIIGIIGIFLT